MHTPSTLTRTETWRLLLLVGAGIGILVNTFQGDGAPLVASMALTSISFATTFSMIRWLGPTFIKAGLKGRDMAKPRKPEMLVYERWSNPAYMSDESSYLEQTRNHGSSVCGCLPHVSYCLHSFRVLQGHCCGHIRWWQSRRRYRRSTY